MRLSSVQNEKVTWGQDQANTLDFLSLLLILGQNSFTRCVTVVLYNPLTRDRRFFLRHIHYRQSLKLVMDLKGRCHCKVYRYWWYPHNTSEEISTPRFEPNTSRLTGHCTTPGWRVVQQWRFRHAFGKRLVRNSSRAPNNWTDVFHNLHHFFHTIKIVSQWAMNVSFHILSHLKLKIILQMTLYGNICLILARFQGVLE